MAKTQIRHPRREESLSREQLVLVSIEILDRSGEGALTFRALSERLVTGPGAIFGHIANKNDLLTAACDAIIVQSLGARLPGELPKDAIRNIALRMFEAMDAHPWLGSALMRAEVHSPLVRILERVGQQVHALGIPKEQEWATVSALMTYMIGAGAQNAANGKNARARKLDRAEFLQSTAEVWLQLDPREYPFAHSVARLLPVHDDQVDFLSGIDLILNGMSALKRSRPLQQR